MKTLNFKKKVQKVRLIALGQLREQAESLGLNKKSLRYLTTVNMVEWYCKGIIEDQTYTIQSFQKLIIDLRKIVNSLPSLVLIDYYAT
jgi:hypothetical protein